MPYIKNSFTSAEWLSLGQNAAILLSHLVLAQVGRGPSQDISDYIGVFKSPQTLRQMPAGIKEERETTCPHGRFSTNLKPFHPKCGNQKLSKTLSKETSLATLPQAPDPST